MEKVIITALILIAGACLAFSRPIDSWDDKIMGVAGVLHVAALCLLWS